VEWSAETDQGTLMGTLAAMERLRSNSALGVWPAAVRLQSGRRAPGGRQADRLQWPLGQGGKWSGTGEGEQLGE